MDLVEEIADRGVTAVLENAEDSDATIQTLVEWLGGEGMSARADEPELRVRAAWEAREVFHGLGVFDRLTAVAILALPRDHDDRDPLLARRLLEDHLNASGEEGDTEEELRTIAALLETDFLGGEEAEVLLERGTALADPDDDPGGTTVFEIAARSYCVDRYIRADGGGDEAAAERWLQRALPFAPAAPDAGGEDLAAVASLSQELDIAQRWPEAAAVYRRLIDASSLDDPSVQRFAIREGELRLMTGDHDGASTALAEVLPHIEARYLDAARDEDVADASDALASTVDCLAVAQGAQQDWAAVCRTLDRTRGLRLRQTASLRAVPEGAELRDLERRLQAALRGAPDSPPPAELLEAYRQVRPRPGELASPDGVELAEALEPGEAVAFVAHHFTGTVVALAVAGPSVAGFVRDDVATADWILALDSDGEEPGWIDMLTDPAAATPGAGLRRLIESADAGVGRDLRALLDGYEVSRVTILAEDILQLIPWWALPSLEDLEILGAGSAAALVSERAAGPVAARRSALIVGNPTLDLPVTAAACDSVRTVLGRSGFETAALPGSEATESAVVAALAGRAILHFGGHGRSDVAYSALELQPDPSFPADPFPSWLAEVTRWRHPEGDDGDDDSPQLWAHRWADVAGRGRLHERHWLASGRLDRWLERQSGTVAATYRDGTCVRVSELWSAADLLVGDALRDCRLAVLTACESAATGRSEDSRALGLPAGLAFAGVGTVVGSLWPVDESLAALWTGAFYRALTSELDAGNTTVDVAGLVHAAANEIRELSREQASARLLELAAGTPDPIARFMLEADAAGLDDPPFAATHHWAAFYVTGQATVTFDEGAQ